MKNGQLIKEKNLRYCKKHEGHGILYPCKYYPKDVLEDIRNQSKKLTENLQNPTWCYKQIKNGCPPIGIDIFRFFAGIE